MTPLFDLYIACCVANGGVAHVQLCADGTLLQTEFVSAPSPLWLTLETNRLHALLCAPFDTDESGYMTALLAENGTLGAFSTPTSTGGGEACFLSVVGDATFVANYQTGSVARLAKDGMLTVRSHEGGGADSTRQNVPHPHYIAPSPDGKYLLCADLGTEEILTYDYALNPLYSAKTPLGSGPRHLAFSPDGRFVYCVGEIGNTVTVFSYENGRLTPLETVDALPFAHGESYAAALRLRDGRLYVSHRGSDCVTVFMADGPRLTFEETIPCGGKWPRDFDLFGEFLVCTNEKSDSVTVLCKREGDWTVCSTLSLPHPLCVVGKGAAYGT